MMSKQLGNWQHLPENPLAFFGLRPGFSRQDLKRAYGKLIRKYRPDQRPQEFQRIRAAFEQLDDQLRYGLAQQQEAQRVAVWESVQRPPLDKPSPPQTNTATLEPPAAGTDWHRLAQSHPHQAYRKLRELATKSPPQYFLLAVLADLQPKSDRRGFIKWILTGLKAHPRDPGLLRLAAEYFRRDVLVKDAPTLLKAAASALASDTFYFLTEPLWRRLLLEQPFAVFQKTLAACERNVRQVDDRSRLVFRLQLLRPALWKASPPWLDQVIRQLEHQGAGFSGPLEEDLELIHLVREYQELDRPRIGDCPVRQQLDEMIRAYCIGDWQTAGATVARVQDSVARNAHGVMNAFRLEHFLAATSSENSDDAVDDSRLISLCLAIVNDIAEQTGTDFGEVSEMKAQRQAAVALEDLRDTLGATISRLAWVDRRVNWLWFLTLVGLPPLLLAGTVDRITWFCFAAIWIPALALFFVLLIRPRLLLPRIERRQRRILLHDYQQNWRPRLFRYIQSCGEPPLNALKRLNKTARLVGDDDWLDLIFSYVQADGGLLLFGRAQAFVT